MINAIIVEDELIQIVYLQNLLSEFCPGVKVIASIHSESEVVQQLTTRCFDLLFLDVKLGKSNAFELLEQLPEIDFHIIFISAFNQYALQAIKSNAIDYLLKPFNGNELQVAVNKAIERIKSRKENHHIPGEEHISKDHCLCISEQDAYTFIPCRDILFCRSEGNYTQLHFINEVGKTEIILATKNLLHFEQKL
ncbi:MAG: response regulator, partial [Bacteroidota bacterium]